MPIGSGNAAANIDDVANVDVDVAANIQIGPLDLPERDRTYSSIWDNDAPGTGHGRSMLDSPQAWSALPRRTESTSWKDAQKPEFEQEWMQINAGSATTVFGVRVRRRVYYNQYVTAITVQYSIDGTSWSKVDATSSETMDGAIFTDTSGNFDARFATAVTAQYIRITVQNWVNHPSMRAGLLVNEKLTGEMSFIGVSIYH